MTKLIAHRGVSAEAPANTMSAFRYAAAQKYDYFSLDIAVTLDGKIVTEARGEEAFAKTYEKLALSDFGAWFSPKFKGEKLPLLSEVLAFAAENGIKVLVNNGFEVLWEDEKDAFFDIIKPYAAIVALACTHIETVKYISANLPGAEIHYFGIVKRELLPEIKAAAGESELTVWLLLGDSDLAEDVKNHALLGFGRIDDYADYNEAVSLGADIISTKGKIKRDINAGFIADMHSHTANSHDAVADPDELCRNNIARGVHACAFTDHSDGHFYKVTNIDIPALIGGSVRDALAMREKYAGKLTVYTGVELGESIWHAEIEKELLSRYDFDAVLGSVHTVRHPKDSRPFAQIDFSTWSDEEVDEFLTMYFADLLETVTTVNCDIMTHLTVPFRYIIGKADKKVDISRYMPTIKKILRFIIDHGIAFEINTSGIGSAYSVLLPDEQFIKLYRDMGGYLVTLASDAHSAEKAANAFSETVALLKKLGFKHIYRIEKRIPVQCTIV
ncbi:MAG: histidinol-phosphatase HisJ family protein [Clostridia bacterium]|nr:histidinol-phosphatase HisJ family protein [Clostridia bacterium]